MGLPTSEWLAQAQRLAVGATARVYHKHERRPNLVVRNLPDKWTAYCHACHQGGVVEKQHVLLKPIPDQQRYMPWPADAKPVEQWPVAEQEALYSLLLSKGVVRDVMFPDVPLWYSREQGRLLFGTALGWLGRATRGQNPKWTGYGFPAPAYGMVKGDPWLHHVVITEDLLSCLKVRWAVRGNFNVTVCALLGTELRPHFLHALCQSGASAVLPFLDGDGAGVEGTHGCFKRLRPLGFAVQGVSTPTGLDPKDLQHEQILELVGGALDGATDTPSAPG